MLLDDKLLGSMFLGTVVHLWYGACQMCNVIPAIRAGLTLSDPDRCWGRTGKEPKKMAGDLLDQSKGLPVLCPVSTAVARNGFLRKRWKIGLIRDFTIS